MFGCERCSNACVTKFNLVISEGTTLSLIFSHSFLSHLSNQLHFLSKGNSNIISDIFYFFVELNLLFLLFILFLHDFTDVGCSNYSNSYISISKSSNIIGTISSIYDPTLMFFEIFNDDLLIMRRSSGKDRDERVIIMRKIF